MQKIYQVVRPVLPVLLLNILYHMFGSSTITFIIQSKGAAMLSCLCHSFPVKFWRKDFTGGKKEKENTH